LFHGQILCCNRCNILNKWKFDGTYGFQMKILPQIFRKLAPYYGR